MKNALYTALIIFVLTLASVTTAWTQTSCLSDGITFTTQEEIDNFPVNYPGCTEIGGGVFIVGSQIKNLHGLHQLEKINVILEIIDTEITDLIGLETLRFISGDLNLSSNHSITSLSGIENLEKISGHFYIINNNLLQSLAGFDSLKFTHEIQISQNPYLQEITGFGNLESISSDLVIYQNPSLVSINAFSKIRTVGSLKFWTNEKLVFINEFDSLEHVQYSILFIESPLLNYLPKFYNIVHVDHLSFNSLPLISDFSVFKNLESIRYFLTFREMESIVDISGLDKLKSVGYINISNNPNLESVDGLSGLEKLNNGRIYVRDNEKLRNIDGFSGLDSCSLIAIYGNPTLESIDGISNLIIDSNFFIISIYDNPLLVTCFWDNMCHLQEKLQPNYIKGNGNGCNYNDILINCGGGLVKVSLLVDEIGDCKAGLPIEVSNLFFANIKQGEFSFASSFQGGISDLFYLQKSPFSLNLSGFNLTLWDVCDNKITINPTQHGDTIFADFILQPLIDCPELTVDLGLPPAFRGCLVTSTMRVRTQNTGTVPAENVQVAVVLPFDLMELEAATPPPVAQSGDTLFFALGDLDIFEVADVNLTVRTRCDTFLLGHTICVEAFAEMDNPCPPDGPVGSIVHTTASCMGHDVVRFSLTNIGDEPTTAPHHYFIIEDEVVLMTDEFDLDVLESIHVDVDATGATFRMEATKLPDGTLTAAALEGCGGLTPGMITAFWLDRGLSNYDIGCRRVALAYDPNDKLAIPTGVGPAHLLAANRPIEYTIRFQNTGTDTAYRVLLTDILPSELDVNTFRPGYASHDYTWEIRGLDTLDVLFFPIALPDSAASQEGSQGFFTFSMDPKPDLPDGTLIQNTASIIFDFNPPIVTNTVFHTIGKLTVSIDQPQPHIGLWHLRGNPMSDHAVFWSPVAIQGVKQFELYDLMGRLVRQEAFSGDEYLFQRGMLRGGMYVFRIVDAQGRQFTGKIVLAEH
jgi:uncharacterized repeat protein (TIGR01451 family)